MAEVIVSRVNDQLASILRQGKLIWGVDREISKSMMNFQAIKVVLADAENRKVKEAPVEDWLTNLEGAFYDIDDAFDEWNTAIQKLKIKEVDNASKRMRKVCFFIPSYMFCSRRVVVCRDLALKLRALNKTLDVITMEKDKFNFELTEGTGELERQSGISVIDPSDVITTEKEKFNFGSMEGTGELERQRGISVIDPSGVVLGRDEEKKTIVNLLLSESSRGPTLPIISIVGLGGIGKTTLAQLVFYDEEVHTHFDKRIWVSASYSFDEIRVAKAILESLKEYDASNLDELGTVLRDIRRCITGKKFLLVLDDVKTKDLECWEQLNYSLKSGSQGSRILVTTSEEAVVKETGKTQEENAVTETGKTGEENIVMNIEKTHEENAVKEIGKTCEENGVTETGTTFTITLTRLSENDSWSLFSQIAFSERRGEYEKFKEIGRSIVDKCKGLPIAVKILGSFLRFKTDFQDWQDVLNSEIWKLAEEKVLFPPLLLSYYDLPSILRKCFSYCAIFPKSQRIEKNRLIKLWMSQSYFQIEGRQEDIESIGEDYFEYLVMRSFFQDFQRNEHDGSIISCKMHNIIHNSAQFLAKNECCIIEVNDSTKSQSESSYRKVHHLMIMFEKEGSFPIHVYNERKLRSLVVEPRGGFMSDIDLSKLFDQLTCLRTLDLSNHDNVWYKLIKEVPKGINNLIHLRYLNLSKNRKIKELPEELCELYNLQTLELSWCTNLKILPQGIGRLINLRHIVNDGTSLSYMPKGIERLTCLQTLSEFVVSRGGNGGKACTLECLKDLKHLHSLGVKKLGNVTDPKEVEKVELKNKENLHVLYISFENDEEKGRMNKDEIALENLQIPPNLERLEIFYYRANIMFSSWIMSLTKLKLMSLDRCMNLEHLPHLGKLPSLESLIIQSMKSVKIVGNEFLGIELDGKSSSSSVIVFPRLKHLAFQKMKEWKEWNYEIARMKEEDVKIMPRLCSLSIGFCPKLETLPDYISLRTTLKELNIISCLILKEHYETRTGCNWGKIPSIKFYHD